MGLTSWGLLGLLSLITGACLAGTVWAWPRLASTGFKTTAARVGLLAGGQLMIILTLLVGVNGYYLFYGTWTDLMGAAGGQAQVRQHPQPGAGANAAAATRVVRTVQAKLGPRKGAKPTRDGQVQHLEITGVRSGITSEAYIYLPPEYFQQQYATKRFPVALFIAGYPSRDRLTWIEKGHLPEEVIRQRAAGRIQPMIYVMMRPTVEPGWDTECADVPGGPKVETFFAQDVPEAILDTYRSARSRHGWGVAGYSAGGYCAVKLAMLHSDRFTAAASLAGHFRAILDTTTRQLYDRSKQLRQDNDLLWRLRNLPQPPVSVLVASASVGEKTYSQAKTFMNTARPPLLVDKVLLPTGGHNFKTFRKYIPPTIEWLSAHLRGDGQ